MTIEIASKKRKGGGERERSEIYTYGCRLKSKHDL